MARWRFAAHRVRQGPGTRDPDSREAENGGDAEHAWSREEGAANCIQDTDIGLFLPPLRLSSHLIRRDRPLPLVEELETARH